MDIGESLNKIKEQIVILTPKRQEQIANWIGVWADYMRFETAFNPSRLMEYRRGDIIHAYFGYNVGSEEGGTRYAVVMDHKNAKSDKAITVIPLSTLKQAKGKDSLYYTEVYLGNVIPNSDVEAFALVAAIRSISKIRIIRPKSAE